MSSRSKTCLLLLQKCTNMKQLRQVHGLVITCGHGHNNYILSRLLAFCSNPDQGSLAYSLNLFQHIRNPTICIYNTIIKALFLNQDFINTIKMYTDMLLNAMWPTNYTFPFVLKACAKLRNVSLGKSIHGHCSKLGLELDEFVGNSLLAMYSAFDDMVSARRVFDKIPEPCFVSWTVMIAGYAKVGDVDSARLLFDSVPVKDRGIWGAMVSGYVQNSCFKEGLYMFQIMQLNGVEPDKGILVSLLCASAHLGALDIGIWIHRYMDRCGFPKTLRLCTGLIDMYAKCGCLDLAKGIFDGMTERDTACWNAMISGFALTGEGENALKLFLEMEKDGIQPDDITYIAVFSACSHSGMVYEGLNMLHKMKIVHGIKLKNEHYGSLIDLLSQAGLIEEAKEVLLGMENSNNCFEQAVAWRALLSASCKYGHAQLAEATAERLVQLEHHSGAYVLLSNFYAAAGKRNDVKRIRKMMKNRGVDKAPGCSSVEINGVVSEFIAGEQTHPQMEEICEVLQKLNNID